MSVVEMARRAYHAWAEVIADLPNYHTAENYTEICPACAFACERAEGASIAMDNAVALVIAGPRPARGVPSWLDGGIS